MGASINYSKNNSKSCQNVQHYSTFNVVPTYSRQQPSQIHDENPRESVMERIMERFGLNEDSDISRLPGEAVDLSNFEEKLPIPSSRLFTQFKFIRNP